MAGEYKISAIPHTNHTSYMRASRSWTSEPQTIKVVDNVPTNPDGTEDRSKLQPNEISSKQFDQLKADQRIRITTMSGDPIAGDTSQQQQQQQQTQQTQREPVRGRGGSPSQ